MHDKHVYKGAKQSVIVLNVCTTTTNVPKDDTQDIKH